jgi:hypothetical protein
MFDRTFRAVIVAVLLALTATQSTAQENSANSAGSAAGSNDLKQSTPEHVAQLAMQAPKRESSNPAMLLAILGLGGFLVVRRANLHQ